MLDNLMLFLIISVFALFYWIYYTGTRKSPFVTQWDQLPTREQYLAAHPEAIDGNIIFCIHCGHHQQLDVGLVHQTDFRRQHICTRCKKTLYREEL